MFVDRPDVNKCHPFGMRSFEVAPRVLESLRAPALLSVYYSIRDAASTAEER